MSVNDGMARWLYRHMAPLIVYGLQQYGTCWDPVMGVRWVWP